jgi:hypothetical protein
MLRLHEASRSNASSSSSSSSLSDNDDLSRSFTVSNSGENIDLIENRGDRDSTSAFEIKEIEALARHDTQMLRTWRTIVLLILLGTFSVVTAGTFFFIHKQKENDDEQSVRLLVTKVGDLWHEY